MEAIEVEPARRSRACKSCGADRPPGATYCTTCAAGRRRTQTREHVRAHRQRQRQEAADRELERQRLEAEEARKIKAQAAEVERQEAKDRRNAFLRGHGF
jgi:uncharacterized Zn finger protein (UPF0148 family)